MVENADGTRGRGWWRAVGRSRSLIVGLALVGACADAAVGPGSSGTASMRSSDVVTTTSSSGEVRGTKPKAGSGARSTSTVATSLPGDDGCGTAAELVRSIGAARDHGSAAEQLDALGAAVDIARPRLAAAEPT